MSTPARVTRRSTRASAAADLSPAKDAAASPVPSHPIAADDTDGPSPPRTTRRKNGSKAAAAGRGGAAASSPAGGPSPAYLLLAVLMVVGGVLYSRYAQPGARPRVPEVQFTREEKAVFEQACEEHYGMPPTPHILSDEHPAEPAGEEEAGVAAADPNRDTGAHAEESFDPAVHAQYLALPPWPEPTEEELTGSWKLTQGVYDYAAALPMTQVLSREKPRVMLFPSFLSPEEVDHMIRISRDNLERSEVLVAEGEDTQSDIRTSFGFWPETDDIIERITERIHRTIGIPEKFGEGLYVLNYQNGQKYEAHNDHCMDGPQGAGNTADAACRDFLKRSGGPVCGPGAGGVTCGDRVATFILYLKAPTKGGQTAFPEAQMTRDAMGAEHRPGNDPEEWYCNDSRALSAAPHAGTAILFWDYRPGDGAGTGSYEDGSAEAEAETVYEAMHAGCPVWEGEKYIATRWIRSAAFDYPRQAPADEVEEAEAYAEEEEAVAYAEEEGEEEGEPYADEEEVAEEAEAYADEEEVAEEGDETNVEYDDDDDDDVAPAA